MSWLDALAALFALAYLPIPIYWLLLHPLTAFWRGRHRAGLLTALLVAWAPSAPALWLLRHRLFDSADAPLWAIALGLALIALDFAILSRVHREMGADRLVGKAELKGEGELHVRGLYARVRHPRYTAMIAGMLGVCLLAATPLLWTVSAIWLALALLAVWLEERELLARFGDSYRDYRARVPAFLPWPRPRE